MKNHTNPRSGIFGLNIIDKRKNINISITIAIARKTKPTNMRAEKSFKEKGFGIMYSYLQS